MLSLNGPLSATRSADKPPNCHIDGFWFVSLSAKRMQQHLWVRLVQHDFWPNLTQPNSQRHPADCHCSK
jgi:hypothetical protein